MSEKVRGFISREHLYFLKETIVEKKEELNPAKKHVEVEITIIEPVYEYQFLLMHKVSSEIILSSRHYRDMADCRNGISDTYEPIRIIGETKRIRK